ncbi:hypothetical protein KAU39_04680 [bacterium]|nr:hypothetical protein [bacterium]
MSNEKTELFEEMVLDAKMCKYELVYLSIQHARLLRKKKSKEFKNNYFLAKEALQNILLKKVNKKEIKEKSEKEAISDEKSSPKEVKSSKKKK